MLFSESIEAAVERSLEIAEPFRSGKDPCDEKHQRFGLGWSGTKKYVRSWGPSLVRGRQRFKWKLHCADASRSVKMK